MRLLDEGAEAKIYKTKLLGEPVLFKSREPKAYRIHALDEKLRRTRTKREAKVMFRANESKINSPKLIALGNFTICMSSISGKLMKDTKYNASIVAKAGKLLAKLHNADIAHGDFTPANIIIRERELFVIDFGLSEITKDQEGKAMDMLLMKRSINAKEFVRFSHAYGSVAESKLILSKLKEIEKRGRYKIRTIDTG